MYNANLDKVRGRKTSSQLRHELKTWEEGQKGPKYTVDDSPAYEVSFVFASSNSTDAQVVKASNNGEFCKLVEKIRQRESSRPASDDVLREGVEEDSHDEHL